MSTHSIHPDTAHLHGHGATLARLTFAMAALCAALAAQAGSGVWTSNGPHGGVVLDLAAGGTPPRLLATGRGGLFASDDGGITWTRAESGVGFGVNYVDAIDAAADGTAYAAINGNAVIRSTDAGLTWSPTTALPGVLLINDVAARADAPSNVVALTDAGVIRSTDGGASWGAPVAGLPATDPLRAPVSASWSATRLYVAYDDYNTVPLTQTVFVSNDNGASFTALSAPPQPWWRIHHVTQAPSDALTIAVVGVPLSYVSDDGGATWTEMSADAAGAEVVAFEPADASHLWFGTRHGLHRSSDGGVTSTPHNTGLDGKPGLPIAVSALHLATDFATSGRIVVGGDAGGLFRSVDAGAIFAAANAGFASTNIRTVAAHPVDPNIAYAGFGDAFTPISPFYRSLDGGLTWNVVTAGPSGFQIRALAVDPTTAAAPGGPTIYAGGLRTHPSDAFAPDSGIYKSSDGGSTWTTLDNGIGTVDHDGDPGTPPVPYMGTVRAVALDPRSCAAPPATGPCVIGPLQRVLVGGSGVQGSNRIYRSLDAGATWTASDTGLPAPDLSDPSCPERTAVIPLAIDPSDGDIVYAGTFFTSNFVPSCAAPTIANGVFKSVDGGATWTHASSGLPRFDGPGTSHADVLAIAIDPASPSTVYAATSVTLSDGRVFKSVDAGATWTEASTGIAGQDVRALLVDPSDSNVVYAASGGNAADPGGVYKTVDGGATWNSISIGLPADAATSLALDPTDAARLLAGTIAGVWELTQVPDEDSDGAATAVEDAAPNGGDADASGTDDSAEAGVASFPRSGAVAPKGGAAFATVRIADAVAGDCGQINDAQWIDPHTVLPDRERSGPATDYSAAGVYRFELPDCGAATVEVTVHGVDMSGGDWDWRMFAPAVPGDAATLRWLAHEAERIAPDTWRFAVVAGETGSYRPVGDHILVVGGAGYWPRAIFADDFDDVIE